MVFFFFKQKTAYEMRISDWSSDVCSSDLQPICCFRLRPPAQQNRRGFPVERNVARPLRFRGRACYRQNPPVEIDIRPCEIEQFAATAAEIGRASCRERVCQYV